MAIKRLKDNQVREVIQKLTSELHADIQFEISLDLTSIPKERITKASNGKKYISLVVGYRKEPDQWGRDLKVYIQQTQEDRKNSEAKIYIGGGKTIIFVDDKTNHTTTDEKESDLPF